MFLSFIYVHVNNCDRIQNSIDSLEQLHYNSVTDFSTHTCTCNILSAMHARPYSQQNYRENVSVIN